MKNNKAKFKNKNLFIFSFLLLVTCYSLLVTSASAWVVGDPIVPCGGVEKNGAPQPECTQCELLHLADNLIDFILIAAAPVLATLFFIIAGVYIMLGGANPGMLATGKRMFSSAFIGILIVMLAWLITNTLITTLVTGTLDFGSASSFNLRFNSADWWRLNCDTIGLKR